MSSWEGEGWGDALGFGSLNVKVLLCVEGGLRDCL